ncbi:DUF4388 domain-containing protein [Dictyobacter arantiisoli]|uniref:Uncharacterized protein n=1 Tax=Dictyobacter arantiisoli TaxID=2014874 RepID=A0A5A5TJA4_9CHLR|nr:DUF4388 domain-containing protein [Dictyobacter arantiisoli]GCF11315.1 hypothetical protein KDI_48790 [Dictyobacter arantiisoli]
MSQQQGRITDSLAQVISTIQQNRMSGDLRVRRAEETANEIGMIVFIDGQAIRAQVGVQQGAAAFETLRTWQRCIFIFAPRSVSNSFQALSPSQTNLPQYNPQLPSQYSPQLPSQYSPQLPSQYSPQLPPQYSPALPPPTTHQLPSSPGQTGEQPLVPIPLMAIPRATMSVVKAIGIINNAGLPRTCRQILLLIDGQHSVNDLVALSNIPHEETLKMLRALEHLSIIIIPR